MWTEEQTAAIQAAADAVNNVAEAYNAAAGALAAYQRQQTGRAAGGGGNGGGGPGEGQQGPTAATLKAVKQRWAQRGVHLTDEQAKNRYYFDETFGQGGYGFDKEKIEKLYKGELTLKTSSSSNEGKKYDSFSAKKTIYEWISYITDLLNKKGLEWTTDIEYNIKTALQDRYTDKAIK